MNTGYLVDRKIRLLIAFVIIGRAYINAFYGIGLSIFKKFVNRVMGNLCMEYIAALA